MAGWMKWAVGEGTTKTVSSVIAKFVGIALNSVTLGFVSTFIIGLIQMIGGGIGAKVNGKTLKFPNLKTSITSALFGITATIMTVLTIVSFMLGADLGIRTFIITMAIIPGAFIDWVFFKHPLNLRQWFLGIPMYLLTGWSILDFPSIDVILKLPLWIWLTLIIAALAAINEGLAQASTKLDPMVNNFWVGLSTILFCAMGLSMLGGIGAIVNARWSLWVGSILMGLVVIAMIVFKLLSYKEGGSIAIKKLIMQGTYLVTAAISGIIIYGEPVTAGKVLGIGGYFLAFSLFDNKTWEFFNPRKTK